MNYEWLLLEMFPMEKCIGKWEKICWGSFQGYACLVLDCGSCNSPEASTQFRIDCLPRHTVEF